MKEIDFLSGLDTAITQADIEEILRTKDIFANAIFNPAEVSLQQKIERCRKAVANCTELSYLQRISLDLGCGLRKRYWRGNQKMKFERRWK